MYVCIYITLSQEVLSFQSHSQSLTLLTLCQKIVILEILLPNIAVPASVYLLVRYILCYTLCRSIFNRNTLQSQSCRKYQLETFNLYGFPLLTLSEPEIEFQSKLISIRIILWFSSCVSFIMFKVFCHIIWQLKMHVALITLNSRARSIAICILYVFIAIISWKTSQVYLPFSLYYVGNNTKEDMHHMPSSSISYNSTSSSYYINIIIISYQQTIKLSHTHIIIINLVDTLLHSNINEAE